MPRRPSQGAITFHKFLQKVKKHLSFDTSSLEEGTFYIFRTDTHQVLARGIDGFEAAKERSNALRKHYGLKWDQVSFKAERGSSRHQGAVGGHQGSVDYSSRINPSKGHRFRGYYDHQGNYHDID